MQKTQLVSGVVLTEQQSRILNFMAGKSNQAITAREAIMDLDITSATLASRISEMKKLGIEIATAHKKHEVTGKKYVEYGLV